MTDVVVGEIGRPHGVRGAVRVRPTGSTLSTRAGGEPVVARLPSGGTRTLTLESLSGEGTSLIARFAESSTRDDAEALRGALLLVAEESLPATAADEFYVRDLVGCRVSVAGIDRGEVVAVHPFPANDVLEVRPAGGGAPLLVPFTHDAVIRLELDARLIEVRTGLLDADAADSAADSAGDDRGPAGC